jgi:hypothetical protein
MTVAGRRVVSPKIKAAIEALTLESRPLPVRPICRHVRQFAQTTGEPLPRYGTVYDLVRDVPVGLVTFAHRGGKAYSEEFDLVHRGEAPRSNSIPLTFRCTLAGTATFVLVLTLSKPSNLVTSPSSTSEQ